MGTASLATCALSACDGDPPVLPAAPTAAVWTEAAKVEAESLEARLRALTAARSNEVVVHLIFDRRADLDLYVTGPREETVYYANSPSRIGGKLSHDQRCGRAGDQPESVHFPGAPTGHYRVGVDYPQRCDGDVKPVPFAVLVETPGGREIRRGLIAHEVFEPIVVEFAWDPEVPE